MYSHTCALLSCLAEMPVQQSDYSRRTIALDANKYSAKEGKLENRQLGMSASRFEHPSRRSRVDVTRCDT